MASSIQQPGITGGRDEVGLVEVVVSHWCEDWEDFVTIGNSTFGGLTERDRRFGNQDQETNLGGFQVDITYVGYSPTAPLREKWSFDTSFQEERIEAHPDWPLIKSIYAGTVVDGEAKFDEFLPQSAGRNRRIGLGGSQGEQRKNPMFGQKTYLRFGAIAIRRYISPEINEFFRGVGKVFGGLPGGFAPDLIIEDDRNWLKMDPKVEPVGPLWDGTERYLLSAPGGWPEGLHKIIEV